MIKEKATKNKKRELTVNLKLMFFSIMFFIILGEILVRILFTGLLQQKKIFADGDYMNFPVLRKNADITVQIIK